MSRGPREGPGNPPQDTTISFPDASTVLVFLAVFAVAISIHEFSHAWMAWTLGDRTAQREGRLTLNPLRHLDPFGTLLPVLSLLFGGPGFGWGKPVPVDPRQLRGGRRGLAAVSAAGPLANVVLALLAAYAIRFVGAVPDLPELGQQFLVRLILLNVSLAVFNLLPVAPLDGFGILAGVVPGSLFGALAWLERYGPGVLLLLIFLPSFAGVDILGALLGPPNRALLSLVQRVAGA